LNPKARPLIKLMMSTAFNSPARQKAIGSCREEMMPTKGQDERGKSIWKTGKELEDSEVLRKARKGCGLKHSTIYDLFSQIYDLLVIKHAPIAHLFGSDAGIRFQRMDSAIMLDILVYFASLGIPCLGVHDSAIVPAFADKELERVMKQVYKNHIGFSPKLKKVA